MGRLWVCLPLCLFMQDRGPLAPEESGDRVTAPPLGQEQREACRDACRVLAIAPLSFPATLPWAGLWQASQHLLSRRERLSRDMAGGLAALAAPTGPSWSLLAAATIEKGDDLLEEICRRQPTRFLQMCLDRYQREVKGYSCTLVKKERINGKLPKVAEITEDQFREKPFSVFMDWKQGGSLASRVLYVEGENKGKVLARAIFIFEKDVDGREAKATSRYLITEFGIYVGARRTLNSMLRAEKRGKLHVYYYGTEKVPQLDGRLCHKFVRTPYDPPDKDGVWQDEVNEITIYIDAETWLQTGSILRGPGGELIGEYFFRNVRLNPAFSPKQFTRGAL